MKDTPLKPRTVEQMKFSLARLEKINARLSANEQKRDPLGINRLKERISTLENPKP